MGGLVGIAEGRKVGVCCTKVGDKVGETVGALDGETVGAHVVLPGIYVGSKVG